MTQDGKNSKFEIEDAIRAVKEDTPAEAEVHAAETRTWKNMQAAALAEAAEVAQIRGCADVQKLLAAYASGALTAERRLLVEAHLGECVVCRRKAHHLTSPERVDWSAPKAKAPRKTFGRPVYAFASVAAIAVLALTSFFIYSAYFAIPAGARARVVSLEGPAYMVAGDTERPLAVGDRLMDGEAMLTGGGGHAFVQLQDGSSVEVDQRSEFAVKARGKNMTVALNQGAVIVQAAKRTSGHLYVKTPDCRVAVKGTVFSVDSGMKGSRVSVIAGVVEFRAGGVEKTLGAGQQESTNANMTPVPVAQDIAWSQNLKEHLALLAQMASLQKKLEALPMPAPRYTSDLLNRVPANTVLYVSIPNLGEALSQANKIFQDQMAQSPELQAWWQKGHKNNQPEKLTEVIEKLHAMSGYLGEEVVVAGLNEAGHPGFAVMAEVRRSGLKDFLNTQFAAAGKTPMTVTDEHGLLALTKANTQGRPVALVRDDLVVFASGIDVLDRINAQLNAGPSEFASTDFGQQIQNAYSRGASFLLAANLHELMTEKKNLSAAAQKKHSEGLERSGFGDMKYLIAEHREINGIPDNRLSVDFANARHGVASWLAAPAPMGSLEFVSPNAGAAAAFILKDPQLILNDVLGMAAASGKAKGQQGLAEAESKLQISIKQDLVAHFGGDVAVALDGPVAPTPSWKLIVEVHDPAGLQATLQKLVQVVNAEAQQHGKQGVQIQQDMADGQLFYTVKKLDTGADMAQYTFAAGYMIVAPSRALLMTALRTQATGDSLARSAEFRNLLPKDQHANYSAIVYQNLSSALQPLMSQLTGQQAALAQQLASDSRPTVVCAWGDNDRIEAASNSRLFGFDLLTMGKFLHPGTSHRKAAYQ